MYIASMRKSFKDSLKVLEADIQHANTLASDYPREYDGACLQMRMSYSPAAHLFLFLVQWTDCNLAGALGLLRILIYKVYVDGSTTIMSTKERKASIREFYAVIYPSLLQLQRGVTDSEDKKQKAVCMERRTRSQSCPFCRDHLKRVNSGDLWVYTDSRDIVDMETVMRENLRRLFMYIDKLPLVTPDYPFDPYDSHLRTENSFGGFKVDEPHASRRRQILSQYPQVKELFGPDPWAFLKITVVVLLQLWTATALHNAGWLKILAIAYFFGSFLNHNLFLAIHELSHNLAFSTPVYNRWLGIFANLPIGVPMSVTFQKYHLEHHRFQGVDGIDMDIPSKVEAHLVTNVVKKAIWVLLQLFFYALRPVFLKPKPPGYWEFLNLFIQIALDVSMVYFCGWKSFAYLILSTFVGGGMHPMAGHFISEHYVFNPDQETYSYYGPLNLLTWSVGYHNEHHDFPRIPGSKLHKVKGIAPEYYEGLESYKSWSQVIYMYIMDRTVGPFSRMKRKPSKSE
ncbi:hypothetical protein ACE6H2_013230 [Prunus campanulata]